jgi:molecular chaperone GrpE (heat shock protein)
MSLEQEFLIDEEVLTVPADFRQVILEAIRRGGEVRRELQTEKLDGQAARHAEEEFLRRLISMKERRCDQFTSVERKRQRESGGEELEPAAREQLEKWLGRLERLQQEIDSILLKYGVTRYEPSGIALPERDDIKGTDPSSKENSGTIVQVLTPGYLLRGHLLRPAEVIVAE